MDGTTAGNGTGPRVMKPVIKNVILASGDQVAIDAVAAKLMGFDPAEHQVHPPGARTGPRASDDPREIEIVGDDIAGENWGFSVGDEPAPRPWLALVVRPDQGAAKTAVPHAAGACHVSFVSEAYHDYYRWPLHERHVYDNWRASTPWGQLFDRYLREGHLRRTDSDAPSSALRT